MAAEHLVTVFLAELLLLLLTGRLIGELMARAGQPSVMGQLLAGVLLGPSVFGSVWPSAYQVVFPHLPEQKEMIDAISQLGILLLLLLTGMEMDWALVKRARRAAFFSSLAGIIFPFACGLALGYLLPDSMLPEPDRRCATAFFLATALAISSVKIVAMVIREAGFLSHSIGQIILTSAIIDDTIGWIIIALIGGLAAHGKLEIAALSFTSLGIFLFLALSLTIGPRQVGFAMRWANDHIRSESAVITLTLSFMCLMALVTDYIGVHVMLGAFVAGVLIGQSRQLKRQIEEQLRGLTVALFAPVFFAAAGLSVDLTILHSALLFKLALGLILVASFGKLAGCYAGGRAGGLTGRESTALALGMNARGSTECIVASIGLSTGVLNQEMFTLIVVMAIATTIMTPPLLRWALGRIPAAEPVKTAPLDRATVGGAPIH